MSILKPNSDGLFGTIKETIKQIKPLERVQVVIPRDYSHPIQDQLDWDAIDELQMTFRGHGLRPNVFMTLRFEDESSEFIVDICCFPS